MASAFFKTFTSVNPFRLYMRGASWAFGFTLVSNLLGSGVSTEPPIRISEHPQLYTTLLLAKSGSQAILWPAVPFKIFNNPRGFFVLGAGIEQATNEALAELNDQSPFIHEVMKAEEVTFSWKNSSKK